MAKLASGPNMSLIDEYQIYLYPVVLGKGTPMFPGPCPPLRLPPAAGASFFRPTQRIFTWPALNLKTERAQHASDPCRVDRRQPLRAGCPAG